jgi:hypothetical protein
MLKKTITLEIDEQTYNDALDYHEGREYCGWNDFFAGMMTEAIVTNGKKINVKVTDKEGGKSLSVTSK